MMKDDYTIKLTDENGVDAVFEMLARIEYGGRDFAVLQPEENSPEDNGMLYIFEIAEELDSDTDTYLGIDDEELIDAVYKAYIDGLNSEE